MCAHVCAILLEVDSQSQPPPPPCINLLQTKTKRIQRRGFSACLFFFFQGCQPLLFKDLTLALQSNKNLFGKLIRLCKLFRFLMQLCVKSSIFHSLAMGSWQMCLLVCSQWPKAFCWSRCKRGGGGGLLAFLPGVFYCWGKRCDGFSCMSYLRNFTFHVLFAVAHLASFQFLAWGHFCWNESGE